MKILNPKLLAQARLRACEHCGKPPPSQAAHLFTKGFGGGQQIDVPENLVALCVLCHARQHNGKEPTVNDLIQIVAAREGWPASFVKEYVWYLQSLSRGSDWQTADAYAATLNLSRSVHRDEALFLYSAHPQPGRGPDGVSS